MSKQLSHTQHTALPEKFPIIILADNLMGDANIGSLFRLADAFNIEKILFCGSPVNLESTRIKRTARATVANVENQYWEDPLVALAAYTKMNYKPVALEITEDSVSIDAFNCKKDEKILLIIGNERYGISAQLLEKVKDRVHINMFGNNSSMNVSQATGIALYEITKTLSSLPKK